MAKDMLYAIYNAEEDCRQREANARAESAERVEQTKADAKQVVLSAKEKAQKNADMLFEKATNITFYVGQSINAAHQGLPIDITMKLKLVESLTANLKKMGKTVVVNYD